MKASHSEIQTYLDCRVKHDFQYRQRLPIVGEAPELNRGLAVHKGMETYLMGDRRHFVDAVEAAHDELERLWLGAERVEYEAVAAAVRAGCEYVESLGRIEILGVEQRISVDFEGWTPNGGIDFLFVKDDLVHVVDWKTCKDLGEPTADIPDGQVSLYAWWAMEEYGLPDIVAGRVYLRCKQPGTELTQKGKFSLTNAISLSEYLEFVERHPEAAIDPLKAAQKFGPWYRADMGLITRRLATSVLRDQARVAAEIAERRAPVPNRRPKMCVRCSYLSQCVDRAVHGEVEETHE